MGSWAWSRISTLTTSILVAVISFALGHYYSIFRHFDNIRLYQDVEVTQVYSPYHYQLMIGYSKYDVSICSDGPAPDWALGETLPILQYEQMNGCKRIYGPDVRFTELRDEKSGEIIFKGGATIVSQAATGTD